MNDICVPIPKFEIDKTAQVEVTVANHKKRFNYRVEAFDWTPDEDGSQTDLGDRISRLRSNIEQYDRNWELVQIYNPGPRDRYIQLLFRQRQAN